MYILFTVLQLTPVTDGEQKVAIQCNVQQFSAVQ